MEADPPKSDPIDPAAENAPSSEESLDGSALVARLIGAGKWPEPALLEQVVAAGEAAVGPLLDAMREDFEADEGERLDPYLGICLLGVIRSPAAIPSLLEIIRCEPEGLGEEAARVLGEFGALAFEPALELVLHPELSGYSRRNAIEAARHAAGADPALRGRLAEILRPMLADAMERTREADRQNAGEAEDEDESEGWTIEDLEREFDEESEEEEWTEAAGESDQGDMPDDLEPYEEVMFLVSDLAAMADPQARPLIKTAFAEGLVDAFWVDEKTVEEQYREGGEAPAPPFDWLAHYRGDYQKHLDYRGRPRLSRLPVDRDLPSRLSSSGEEPEPPPPETIRNTGPKLGRNDPCWCGSGKKYKKCHFGKDQRS